MIFGAHKWKKATRQNAVDPDKLKECKRCGEMRTVKLRQRKPL